MLFYDDLSAYIEGQRQALERLSQANMPERAVLAQVLMEDESTYPTTTPVASLEVDALGISHGRHRCATRPSSARETGVYPRGTVIRQHRHLCAVSLGDCRVLSERLGVEVTPALLGANLVLARHDGQDFSLSCLPRQTHMLVVPAGVEEVPKPPLATLVRYVHQRGCGVVGKAIADHHGDPSLVRRFRDVSREHRGLICSVEFPVTHRATLSVGQQVVFRFSTGTAP